MKLFSMPPVIMRKTPMLDVQLIDRRRVEYDIFLLVEELHVLDIIQRGFESVDEFIALANSVSNRRKSRAGKSRAAPRASFH
jgi:hypothetical protein